MSITTRKSYVTSWSSARLTPRRSEVLFWHKGAEYSHFDAFGARECVAHNFFKPTVYYSMRIVKCLLIECLRELLSVHLKKIEKAKVTK